jgi:PAS domain S-box-containing protein
MKPTRGLTFGRTALLIGLILGMLNVLQGTISLMNLYRTRNTVNALNSDTYAALYWAGKLKGVAKDQRIAIVNFLNATTGAEWDTYEALVLKAEEDLREIRNSYPKFDPRDQEAINISADAQGRFFQAWLEIKDLVKAGKKKEAQEIYNTKLMQATLERRRMEDYLAVIDKERGDRLSKDAIHSVAVGFPIVWSLLFLTVGLSSGAFFTFVRSVRRTNRELEEITDRLTLATRAGGVGVWVDYLSENRVSWDEQMCRLYGIAPGSFAGTNEAWYEMVHPEDRQQVHEKTRYLVEKNRIIELEHRIVWPDGSIHYIRAFFLGQRDHSGRLLRVVGTNWDITPMKQAADDLARKASFQQALLDSADFAIISTTVDGVITSFSRGAEDLLGYTAAEVVGKANPSLYHDSVEIAARAQDLTRELGRKIEPGFEVFVAISRLGRSETREWNYVRKDGSRVPALVSVGAIHDEKGGIAGFLGVARDLSQINQATAALGESESKLREMNAHLDQLVIDRTEKLLETEERFRLMVEGVKDYAIIMLDAEGLVVSWNAGAQRFKGYSDEEIIGKHFSTFYVPEDVKLGKPQKALETAATEGRFEDEGWRIRKDGSRFWESVVITALHDTTGRLRGFAKVARDITEHRDSEALKLRTQRLESIGTLAGGIAHDLNNALAPILMGVELIRLDYPHASGTVDIMEASARHGAGMVRQLLTFAKGIEGERVLINPRHLFDQIGAIVEGTFPKSIVLRKRCPSDLHAILGDATQLYQVLLNLCVNARDAMPSGGALTLDAGNTDIDETYASSFPDAKPGSYVVWRVQDTGTGIPPEVLERIFEPFYSTKGPDKGTGLGLSTVLGIVRSHGGFVRVYSVAGKGSTFAIYLPADPSASASRVAPTITSNPFFAHGEMVLVVDDEVTVRKISRAVLTAMKFQVVTASDGTEALMQVAERRADLRVVITDLHMPNMDGLTFVRVLRHMMPDVGIIVSSGRVEERDRLAFNELGVTVILEKPFSREKLITALQSVLQSDVTFSI